MQPAVAPGSCAVSNQSIATELKLCASRGRPVLLMQFTRLTLTAVLAALTLFLSIAPTLLRAAAEGGDVSRRERNPGFIGIEMRDLTAEEAERFGFDAPTGILVVRPLPGSPAEKAGLAPGDAIVSVDGIEIPDADVFQATMASRHAGAEVRLRVLREGRWRTITAILSERPSTMQLTRAPAGPLWLMTDTGGHSGRINALVATADGKTLISAGDDKVIRVWDVESGAITRRIRGEVGAGMRGAIYALAVSRDGKWLAAGGDLSYRNVSPIRLYDLETGELVRLLIGHDSNILALGFSPDGQLLISGSHDGTAIIWDVDSGSLRHRLAGPSDAGEPHRIEAVSFSPDGRRAVAGGFDGRLMIWDVASGRPLANLAGHKAQLPAIAISPADGTIASGGSDGEIRLWDGETGAPRLLPGRKPGPDGNVLGYQSGASSGGFVTGLAFSPDGRALLSTCGRTGCDFTQRTWDVETGTELAEFAEHDNSVGAGVIITTPQGELLAATAGGSDRSIRLWHVASGHPAIDANGLPRHLVGRGAISWAAGVAMDGKSIAWGYQTWQDPTQPTRLEYALPLPTAEISHAAPLPLSTARPQAFQRAITNLLGVSLAHSEGGRDGFTDGTGVLTITRSDGGTASIVRGVSDGRGHIAYTLTPDASRIVSGGGFGALIAYDLHGRPVANFRGHTGMLLAVAPSPDGRLLITTATDQTIRLWPLEKLAEPDAQPSGKPLEEDPTGYKVIEPIVTILHLPEQNEWVIWTPEGYYSGSSGADDLIGWQLNKGPDKTPGFISAAQLRRQFHRPDIVAKAIALRSSWHAVDGSHGTTFALEDLLHRTPPRLTLQAPRTGQMLSGGETTVRLTIEPTADPAKRLAVRVNGRLVLEDLPDRADGMIEARVPLAEGDNVITVVASNEVGETTATARVRHAGPGRLDRRGTLYVVAIGIDKYTGVGGCAGRPTCDLEFAGKDAAAFVAAITNSLGPLHKRVDVQLLTNDRGATQPTADAVRDALHRVRNQADDTDTVVVFAAGHGVNDGPDYLLLPTDATREGRGWRGSSVVKWVELESIVFGAYGRRLLFLDTCHSAGAYNAKLANEAHHNDVTAFSAAGADQFSLEHRSVGHGLFTYALVNALGPEARNADTNADGVVRVSELAAYLVAKTSALIDSLYTDIEKTAGMQKPLPRVHRGRDADDHILASVR